MIGTFSKGFSRLAALLFVLVVALPPAAVAAEEAIAVTQPWARATVPGQKVAGIYMEILSREDARLTGVSSPAAESAELHWMKMEGGTMKMRAVDALELPAGKAVSLAPGGYHVMLFGLKQPLVAGEKVALTLTVESAGQPKRQIPVTAVVRGHDEPADAHKHH